MGGIFILFIVVFFIGVFVSRDANRDKLESEYFRGMEKGFNRGLEKGLINATNEYQQMEKKLQGYRANFSYTEKDIYTITLIHKKDLEAIDTTNKVIKT